MTVIVLKLKILGNKKKKLALTLFKCRSHEIRLNDMKTHFHEPRFYDFYTLEDSEMFKLTSKFFSIVNNTLPANCTAYISRDFLTYFSFSYFSFMVHL